MQNIIIPTKTMENTENKNNKKTAIIVIAIVAVLILAGMLFGIITLAKTDVQVTGQIRDIFIIILALESLLIGAALIILVIQLALLSNLIQHEIRPILNSTKETVQTVKGTSKFISEKAVNPIVSIVGLVAGGRKLFELVGFIKNSKKE